MYIRFTDNIRITLIDFAVGRKVPLIYLKNDSLIVGTNEETIKIDESYFLGCWKYILVLIGYITANREAE